MTTVTHTQSYYARVPGNEPSTRLHHHTPLKFLLSTLVLTLTLFDPASALAQKDDFDDGDDVGWTIYDPLKENLRHPVSTNYVENGAYRILALPPYADAVGAGRGGAYRTNVNYTSFYVAADIVAWDDSVRQFFGLGARLAAFGPASTRGYVLGYDRGYGPAGGEIWLAKMAYESLEPIGNSPARLQFQAGQKYRLVFIGKGGHLRGFVYKLPDTFTPLLQLSADDDTYPSGLSGMLVFGDYEAPVTGAAGGDATFDNYLAMNREPPTLQITPDVAQGYIYVTWPADYPDYTLESTREFGANLSWKQEPAMLVGNFYLHTTPISGGTKFFRLKQ